MRVDSNLSLRPIGQEEFGTRTETKNINSLKSVEQAVRYEMQRQAQVLTDGGFIRQETRHYQETDGSTSAGRIKETAEDYRYFNDPDLPPVIAPREWVEEIRATLPELPWVRRARLQEEWGISDAEMRDLVNAGALNAIIATVEEGATADEARAWWGNSYRRQGPRDRHRARGPGDHPRPRRPRYRPGQGRQVDHQLGRQAVDGVLAGRATSTRSSPPAA